MNKQIEIEGQALIDNFKDKLKQACEDVLSTVYVDIMPHIDSDAWLNYRNDLRQELSSEYSSPEFLESEHVWARDFRKRIFQEYKSELTKGLNKDLLYKITRLEETIKHLQEMRSY